MKHARAIQTCLFSLTLLGSVPLQAQEDDGPPIPEDRLEEIKAQKSAYLTRKMDLSPEEAQKFWPVYNQYDKELEDARKEMREYHRSMKGRIEDLSESDASQMIDRELGFRQRDLDIRKKYTAEFKRTVGAQKTLQLFKAERDFNRELLKRLRDQGTGRDGPPPGGMRRHAPNGG
ncbi:MAG: hypothetical protein H6597_07845 [Flavobacteriales bacterium]|nr:hypothetical protein [Flavobacteriales bacterium]MCB9194429.1 hypothetical protein [Flavobacteriales bacterium]